MLTAAFTTFDQVVRERAATLGDADAFVFLGDGDGDSRHLTYSVLDRRARALALRLTARGARSGPVLLLYPPGPEFVVAFVACLYAGAVAVPAPLPGERPQRVSGIVRDVEPRVVLTDAAHAADHSPWLALAGGEDTALLVSDLDDGTDPDDWRPPANGPDDLALLQYTSGSTRQPRGVMVSHRNLVANQTSLQRLLGSSAEDRFTSWLPHYHDMGLVAHVLHPLWLGTHSVQMSSVAFVKRPVDWLRSIGEYGLTIGGGPNFGYDLCTRRVSDAHLAGLDLSSWRLALCGAEPVRSRTLDSFTRRFAPAGLRATSLYPGYGLSEATLVVSGGRPGAPAGRLTVDAAALEHDELRAPAEESAARTLVGAGRAPDLDLRIVDPAARAELPAGRVGEIWLRGDSVAVGYWRRPEESAATFHAALDGVPGVFLRTGDLGAVHDGELYITGRLKEVIILNGRNIYPQDVEWAIRDGAPVLATGHSAVFTVGADPEQLVVVHELRTARATPAHLEDVVRGIRAALGRDFDLPGQNIVLVGPGVLRRTSSGKVQRVLMRRLFLRGEVPALFDVLDPAVRAVVASGAATGDGPAHPAARSAR
ncbi:fatty acyl-AMP ligase [Streptomyces sp. NPDC026672]|uniref:fatty acyl-AMP ligase n=1 Tax=unclassified Streptomyces TaxID=2593676 RepID=UPI003404EB1F